MPFTALTGEEDPKSVFIESNIPIRTNPNNLRDGAAPDLCRSRNVNAPAIYDQTGYNLWEVGKPPEFVLEVASESTYENDLYEKPGIYAAMGIDEYWMFDPTGGDLYGQALTGFKLVDGEYEPIEITPNEHGLMSGYSEELGVRLCAVEESRREGVAERSARTHAGVRDGLQSRAASATERRDRGVHPELRGIERGA